MKDSRFFLSLFVFVSLLIVTLSFYGCSDEDQEDGSSSSGEPDDDDQFFGDDDDQSGDDDSADDDNSGDDDDSTDDDDSGDDDDLDELMITGWNGVSFMGPPGQWTPYDIPAPQISGQEEWDLGPTVVVDGQVIHGALNIFDHIYVYSSEYEWSAGHEWIRFDSAQGWQKIQTRQQTARKHNIFHLGLDHQGILWAGSSKYFNFMDHWNATDFERFNEVLFRYPGNVPEQVLPFGMDRLTAMAVTESGTGLACTLSQYRDSAQLWNFDGEDWIPGTWPEGWDNGYLSSILLTGPDSGFVVHIAFDGHRTAIEIDEGYWVPIALPESCDYFWPRYVAGTEAHVLFWDSYHLHNQFLQRANDRWECRRIPGAKDSVVIQSATAFTNGRGFVLANSSRSDLTLYEVLPDELVPFDMPENLNPFARVHAMGPNAPARQASQY